MKKGKFITIDGVEGAGKSTQIDFICQYLSEKGVNVVLTREPGGTELGEKIRDLLLSTQTKSMHSDTELMLMFAARNEHIHAGSEFGKTIRGWASVRAGKHCEDRGGRRARGISGSVRSAGGIAV